MKLLILVLLETMLCFSANVSAQIKIPYAGYTLTVVPGQYSILMEDPLAEKGKVTLKWKLAEKANGYFNVERAPAPEGPFELLSAQKADSANTVFIDEQPQRGRNYYRIRWVPLVGEPRNSNLVTALFAGDMTCKFYPNPVDNMLIVRSEQPLDLLIIDQQGTVKTNISLKGGLQTVDLTRLEKGLYIISLTEKESGKVLTEKLVKN